MKCDHVTQSAARANRCERSTSAFSGAWGDLLGRCNVSGVPEFPASAVPPTVLVVDDDSALRLAVGYILASHGFAVREAENGAAALASIASKAPDLILIDWSMPVLDGLAVTVRLKGDDRTRKIPVIMLSAEDDPGKRNAALEAGVQEFLTKPFKSRVLMARVSQLIGRDLGRKAYVGAAASFESMSQTA